MSGRIIIVTGTTTGVGKTVATAALAVRAAARGSVIVLKPVQTGIQDGDSDAEEVRRLTGGSVEECTALDEPLAPDTAARRQGVSIPLVGAYVDRVRELARTHDTVIVEGSGGLLVRLDADGGTLLDLAASLTDTLTVEVIVVVAPGLGTLNHAELTVGALRARELEPAGLVIGSWPVDPGLAERCNVDDLPHHTGVPVIATIPEGAGSLGRADFIAQSPSWFAEA